MKKCALFLLFIFLPLSFLHTSCAMFKDRDQTADEELGLLEGEEPYTEPIEDDLQAQKLRELKEQEGRIHRQTTEPDQRVSGIEAS